MDMSTDIGKIIGALRQELRQRGFHNSDVASRLKVSDTTVKRYLRGQGVSLPILEKLAALVDLDLLSLVALARQQNPPKLRMTPTQEEALGRCPTARAVFFQLSRGNTILRIEEDVGLTPQIMDMQLAKLQSLRLIRRLADGTIEILAHPLFEFDAKETGALTGVARNLARHFLADIDLHDEHNEWFYTAYPLSQETMGRVRELIKKLTSEMRKLGKRDATLPERETSLYQFFIAAQPTTRETFLRRD